MHAAFWYRLFAVSKVLPSAFCRRAKKPPLTDDIAHVVGVYAICQGVQHSLGGGVIDGERDNHLLDQPPGGDISRAASHLRFRQQAGSSSDLSSTQTSGTASATAPGP